MIYLNCFVIWDVSLLFWINYIYFLTWAGSATITLFAISSTSDTEKGPGGCFDAGRSLFIGALFIAALLLGWSYIGGLLKSLLRLGAGITLSPVSSSAAW